jgi:hypothetical protein
LSSVYSQYKSVVKCPGCGLEFEAPHHSPRGSGAHYIIPALNKQHKLILFILAQHSGGLTLNEVYRRIIEHCNEHHLPYMTKGSVAGRLSEMANPAISLVREIEVLGKWYYSITEDGRKIAAEATLWRFDNIEEEPAKNPNIGEAILNA